MIKPEFWGPPGWKFMHYISLGYPIHPSENDKLNYKNFYYSLQYILSLGIHNLIGLDSLPSRCLNLYKYHVNII